MKELFKTLDNIPKNTELEFEIPPLRTPRKTLCVRTTLFVGKSDPFVNRSLQ